MSKRPSIKAIFAGWRRISLLLFIVLLLLAATTISNEVSFSKSANLVNQKRLVDFVANIGREDLELASIQYRGKTTQLGHEIDKLKELDALDILGQTLLGYSAGYREDLDLLSRKRIAFTEASGAWYAEDADPRTLEVLKSTMDAARYDMQTHIDRMLQKNIGYDLEKYNIQKWLIYAAFAISLFTFFFYNGRFKTINRDVQSLYAVEATSDGYKIVTEEIDIIGKRMSRKSGEAENPAFIDPLTEINNYKGLLHNFANRATKQGQAVCICVFEVDGFTDIDRKYPKAFGENVLKKIAFMLSLHRQHTDILARIDYSQFAVVIVRQRAEQALRECNDIRQSIEETSFKVPKGESIHLTVSGGFTQKLSSSTFEETIEQAKQIAGKTTQIGGNSIKQAQDFISA